MRKSFLFILTVTAFFAVAVFSCRQSAPKPRSVYYSAKDSYGREVVLEKEPQRIVSLSPAITEALYLLGADDKLAGVSDFCEYPPEAAKIPKVGGMRNINMEVLLSLHPDVVLIGSIVSAEDVRKIENMHIPVVAVREEEKLDGMADMIDVLGAIANRRQEAAALSRQWRGKLARLRAGSANAVDRKSVYYVVGFGDGGDFTAPASSHIHDIITLAGGRNVGEGLAGWNVSREFLFRADPDIIVIRSEDLHAFCTRHPYTELTAVRQNRVYPIESGTIDIVSPRNLAAVDTIRALLSR